MHGQCRVIQLYDDTRETRFASVTSTCRAPACTRIWHSFVRLLHARQALFISAWIIYNRHIYLHIYIKVSKYQRCRAQSSHPSWQTSCAFGIAEHSSHATVVCSTCHLHLPIKIRKLIPKPFFISPFFKISDMSFLRNSSIKHLHILLQREFNGCSKVSLRFSSLIVLS